MKNIKILFLSIVISALGIADSYAFSRITKIQGTDRYHTASMISERLNYDTAILVNADETLADGLSTSSLSGVYNAPILLTNKNKIPSTTKDRLKKVNNIYIIGSENAIGLNVENEIKSMGISVNRIEGKNRIETSYNVAKEVKKVKDIDKVILVNGYKGEADAMSIAGVSSKYGYPIILTDGKDINFELKGVECYIVGSNHIMSENIEKKSNAIRIGGNNRYDTNKKVIEYFYKNPKNFI